MSGNLRVMTVAEDLEPYFAIVWDADLTISINDSLFHFVPKLRLSMKDVINQVVELFFLVDWRLNTLHLFVIALVSSSDQITPFDNRKSQGLYTGIVHAR